MAKTIVKEIIIMLLLCLAIILLLGILLYEYVPMTKTVPSEVAYSTPEEVKQELLESGEIDESKIIMTYEIDATDLNNYARIQDYKPGKSNPFSSYETEVTEENKTEGSTTNSNGASTSSGTSSSTSNSNGTQTNNNQTTQEENKSEGFYPDEGTK